MKRIALLVFTLIFLNTLYAQQLTDKKDFEKIVKNNENYYQNSDKGKGTGYKQFKRWENFVQHRLDANGYRINSSAMAFQAFENLKRKGEINSPKTAELWTELGPDTWSNNPDPYPDTQQGGWNPGNGRINEIAFHPTNQNIFYAGASGGGVWKTTDGGNTWNCMTDDLIDLAISGIVVDHSNPNIVYILTGDGDSEDLVSIGVLKSTNGGSTWNTTGLSFDRDEIVFGTELKMDPEDSDNIIATTTNGIYRTTNGGNTWPLVLNGHFYDVEYNTADSDTVFASTDIRIFRSADGGNSWAIIGDGTSILGERSRVEIAVTPASPSSIYAVFGDSQFFRGVYYSTNGGADWESQFTSIINEPNILASHVDGKGNKTQASFDLAIEVSPNDPDVIFVGGINIWKSENKGEDWSAITYWRHDWDTLAYVHADIHELIFNGIDLYAGCDGGVFKSSNMGTSWSDLSEGLRIMQPHKIGITNANTNLVYMGTQDNGINKYSGTMDVDHVRGADGLECIIMPSNQNHVYSSRQRGIVELSTDGGFTFDTIIVDSYNKLFNNPFLLKPVTNDYLITARAGKILIHNLDGTAAFEKEIPMVDLQFVKAMDISLTNENLLIAASRGNEDSNTNDHLYKTETLFMGQNSWVDITGNLPVQRYIITDIVIDPNNESHFLVTFGGYEDGNKVFETWNKGQFWENVSYNLENIPVNCIVLDPEVPNSMYIGTDIGVFNRENEATNWVYSSNGLPPVMIHELEINTKDNLIYAASYGRGLWVSSFGTDCPANYILTNQNDPSIPGFSGVQNYTASESILSARHIIGGAGTEVLYQAGDFIDLKPGFIAEEGNDFEVKIGDCENNKNQYN